MKISIEIELQENEIDLATELLSTLRKLTDHVQVKTRAGPALAGNESASSSYKMPGMSLNGSKAFLSPTVEPSLSTPQPLDGNSHQADFRKSAQASPVKLHRPVTPPPGMPLPGPPPPTVARSIAPPATPAPTSSNGPVVPQSAASQASSQTPLPSSQAPPQEVSATRAQQVQPAPASREMIVHAIKTLMMQLDCSLDDYGDKFQSVSANLPKILEQSHLGPPKEMFDRFYEAFTSILFDQSMVANGKSMVPYMSLLPTLPEPFKTDIREPLIAKVLKHLTIPRPLDGNRAEFFAQAEAFACLVSLEFVAVQGAVQTLCTLLKDEKKRCAAVTMLGKTAEHCAEQLKRDCPQHHLDALRQQMDMLEPLFDYDKSYIFECLGWGPVTPQTGSAGSNGHTGSQLRLALMTSFAGHSDGIFALAWDTVNQQLASSSKDGRLLLWDSQGQQLQQLSAPTGWAYNGMAWAAEQGFLAAVGLGATPRLDVYRSQRGSLNLRASLTRSPAALLSAVAALPGTSEFAIGEKIGDSGVVSLYDFNSLPRNGEAQPTSTLKGKQDLVTAVAPFGSVPVLLSGGRDGTIAVWDVRQGQDVITLVGSTQGDDSTSMVTTIDAQDTTVVAGSLDTYVSKWDLRSATQQGMNSPLASVSLDGSAVLRVALGGSPGWAAMSTIDGLYFGDPFAPSLNLDDIRVGMGNAYADVKWGVNEQVLYAGGEQQRIDVYTMS